MRAAFLFLLVLFLCFLTYFYPVLRWFFSGVVSSIGLGTGANTGVLFLMPYTASVAKAHGTSFWTPYLETLPATILHAVGSACGELPPFYLADKLVTKLPKAQIDWMIRYMQAYGWWMIFAFACWPSMFFDMCGLCAGLLKVDTPTFLSATAAGKVVKSCVLSATLVLAVQQGKDVLPEVPQTGAISYIGYGVTAYALVTTCKAYHQDEKKLLN